MVSAEIDINGFERIGVYFGDDGKEYLIMVDVDLPESRKSEILMEMVLRKIDLKGHKYIPEKKTHERLCSECK